jgi:hypothetical protein
LLVNQRRTTWPAFVIAHVVECESNKKARSNFSAKRSRKVGKSQCVSFTQEIFVSGREGNFCQWLTCFVFGRFLVALTCFWSILGLFWLEIERMWSLESSWLENVIIYGFLRHFRDVLEIFDLKTCGFWDLWFENVQFLAFLDWTYALSEIFDLEACGFGIYGLKMCSFWHFLIESVKFLAFFIDRIQFMAFFNW